jgi:hypothetical protein
VLDNLSENIRECYRQAEDLARIAKQTRDPALKRDYLNAEQRWLALARSYEFTERLSHFTFNNKPKRR